MTTELSSNLSILTWKDVVLSQDGKEESKLYRVNYCNPVKDGMFRAREDIYLRGYESDQYFSIADLAENIKDKIKKVKDGSTIIISNTVPISNRGNGIRDSSTYLKLYKNDSGEICGPTLISKLMDSEFDDLIKKIMVSLKDVSLENRLVVV